MGLTKFSKYLVIGLTPLFVFSCAAEMQTYSGIDESGDESVIGVDPGQDTGSTKLDFKEYKLTSDINVRYLKNNVLEYKIDLPTGTTISVVDSAQTYHYDFRSSSGELSRSSTGFLSPIQIVSVPAAHQSRFSAATIKSLNQTPGGLFISSSIMGTAQSNDGSVKYAVIAAASAGVDFLKLYDSKGKPKFSYRTSITKRFGTQMNKVIPMSSLSVDKQKKWNAIYAELVAAVNRKVATPKSYLIMDKTAAQTASINYEKYRTVLTGGAWTIATQATAVRHGFPNVPCAETQSEILRQAYKRAGYDASLDFNKTKGNQLIWSNTASVKGFSAALYNAGWIPWDSTIYKPLTGAFLMNGSGLSPGHTYIAAGDDGQIIVDNGAPQGRDLRKTSYSSLNIQYQTGVFFLPPGIIPPKW